MNTYGISSCPRANKEERLALLHKGNETIERLTYSSPLQNESDGSHLHLELVNSFREYNLRRFNAIALAILSGIAFLYCALTVHLLDAISPSEILLFRTGEQTVLIGTVVCWRCYRRRDYDGGETSWRLVCGQGTVMAISLQLLFIAFQRLPLGDASALIFSAPAHVSVLAWIILGERPTVPRVLAVLGIVGGGVMVCQTTRDLHKPVELKQEKEETDWKGLTAAIVGTFGYSLHYVLIRKIRSVHFSMTTLSLSLQTFLLSALILVSVDTFKVPDNDLEWVLLSTVGIVGTLGHVFLALALSMEEAAVIASTRSLDIAVAYMVQVVICHEPITAIGIGGATLISFCVTFMALEPYIIQKIYTIVGRFKNTITNVA